MRNHHHLYLALAFVLAVCAGPARAQSPGFEFTGGLADGENPANGDFEMTFTLFNAETGGEAVTTVPFDSVTVVDGLYDVTLPIPAPSINFTSSWIEVAARPEGSADPFTVLTPRLRLKAVPLATRAELAEGVAEGAVTAEGIAEGTITGDKIATATIEPDKLSTTGASSGQVLVFDGATATWAGAGGGWQLQGNAGTVAGQNFLGTTDEVALELRANNQTGLRLIPGAFGINVVGGAAGNTLGADVSAATIAGGSGNTAGGLGSTVGGGTQNTAAQPSSTVAGGSGNTAGGSGTVVAGGSSNEASGFNAAALGGSQNLSSGELSTVGAGFRNTAEGGYSTVIGGRNNNATQGLAFVGGGASNTVSGVGAIVVGGARNVASGRSAGVTSGTDNSAVAEGSVVSGGRNNTASAEGAMVGAGLNNSAGGQDSFIGSGINNEATGFYTTIPGGLNNRAAGSSSFAAGQFAEAIHDSAFVWSDASGPAFTSTGANQFLVRAAGGVGVGTNAPKSELHVAGTITANSFQLQDGAAEGLILTADADGNATWRTPLVLSQNGGVLVGSQVNDISENAFGSVISGGSNNNIDAPSGAIGGGSGNTVSAFGASVFAGTQNNANGELSFLGGGFRNSANGLYSTVSGGRGNEAAGEFGTISGGASNVVTGAASTVAGGARNSVSGRNALIGGGVDNTATADNSVIAGGANNEALGSAAAVGGGENNRATAGQSVVAGGLNNEATGFYSSVPGGLANKAGGTASFAAGQFAEAMHTSAFVWSDSSGPAFGSTAANQFLVRAAGGFGVGTNAPKSALHVAGTITADALALSGGAGAGLVLTSDADGNAVWTAPYDPRVDGNILQGNNTIAPTAFNSVVAGGSNNEINGGNAIVGGGTGNRASAYGSATLGGSQNASDGELSFAGGGFRNTAGGLYSTVAGGRNNHARGALSSIGGGASNRVNGASATIAGGSHNVADGPVSAIGGGSANRTLGRESFVGAGNANHADGAQSIVAGGMGNTASGIQSFVGSGIFNEATGYYSVVAGGLFNLASGDSSFAAGQFAEAVHASTFVWSDGSGPPFATTGRDQFLIRANGGVGIGANDPEAALDVNGEIRSRAGFVFPDGSVQTTAAFDGWSFIDGTFASPSLDAPLVFGLGETPALRLSSDLGVINVTLGQNNSAVGTGATVGGGQNNDASDQYSTIGGGASNLVEAAHGVIGGGLVNSVVGAEGAVLGGTRNIAWGQGAFVGAGGENQAFGTDSVIGGGWMNATVSDGSTVGGGLMNAAGQTGATVGGGSQNEALGTYSTVPGGILNRASGFASLASGILANARHDYAFVWSDSSVGEFKSSAPRQFLIQSLNGVGVNTNAPKAALHVNGSVRARAVELDAPFTVGQVLTVDADGRGTWQTPTVASLGTTGLPLSTGGWLSLSDRDSKEDVQPVDSREVLQRLVAMPMSTWNYKAQDNAVRHIGPMAQDFHAAFALGESESHINSIDADGVALVAIQGLNQLVEEKDAEISELKTRLAELERVVNELAANPVR